MSITKNESCEIRMLGEDMERARVALREAEINYAKRAAAFKDYVSSLEEESAAITSAISLPGSNRTRTP